MCRKCICERKLNTFRAREGKTIRELENELSSIDQQISEHTEQAREARRILRFCKGAGWQPSETVLEDPVFSFDFSKLNSVPSCPNSSAGLSGLTSGVVGVGASLRADLERVASDLSDTVDTQGNPNADRESSPAQIVRTQFDRAMDALIAQGESMIGIVEDEEGMVRVKSDLTTFLDEAQDILRDDEEEDEESEEEEEDEDRNVLAMRAASDQWTAALCSFTMDDFPLKVFFLDKSGSMGNDQV